MTVAQEPLVDTAHATPRLVANNSKKSLLMRGHGGDYRASYPYAAGSGAAFAGLNDYNCDYSASPVTNGDGPIHYGAISSSIAVDAGSTTSSYNAADQPASAAISSSDETDDLPKPDLSYASLIGKALVALPENRARLNTIYQWITANFPYYRPDRSGWQNSIRHNLTVNKCFVKDPRPDDPPGKGSFWKIDPEHAKFFENGVFEKPTPVSNTSSNAGLTSCSGGSDDAKEAGKLRRMKESEVLGASAYKRSRKRSRTSAGKPADGRSPHLNSPRLRERGSGGNEYSACYGETMSACPPPPPTFFSVFRNSPPPPLSPLMQHASQNNSAIVVQHTFQQQLQAQQTSTRSVTPVSYQHHPSLVPSSANTPEYKPESSLLITELTPPMPHAHTALIDGCHADCVESDGIGYTGDIDYQMAADNLCRFALATGSPMTCPADVFLMAQKMNCTRMDPELGCLNTFTAHDPCGVEIYPSTVNDAAAHITDDAVAHMTSDECLNRLKLADEHLHSDIVDYDYCVSDPIDDCCTIGDGHAPHHTDGDCTEDMFLLFGGSCAPVHDCRHGLTM